MANRHDVYIWDATQYPEPESLQQAADLAFDLATKDSVVNPHFVTLIQKTKVYIQQQDAEVQNAYQDFSNRLENNMKACLMLSLPEYGAELGLHFIVQIAMALNLAVYDHEMRLVFLPPSIVLPIGAVEYWDALCESLDKPDFPSTDNDFAQWFEPHLSKMLERYDFVSTEIRDNQYIQKKSTVNGYTIVEHNKYYVRKVPIGEQHIWITYGDHKYRGEYIPYLNLGVLCLPVVEILKLFNFELPSRGGGGYCFKYNNFGVNVLLKKFINNFELAFKYITLLENQLISMANATTTIKDLADFLYTGKESTYIKIAYNNSTYAPFTLVLTYLSNSSNFEEIAQILAHPQNLNNETEDSKLKYYTEYKNLLKYLRDEVKPLI